MRRQYPNNKHYLTFDTAMKQRFGHKMIKLCLNAGFTCPNRDGTTGTGGCIYCTASGSGDFAGNPSTSVTEQLTAESMRMKTKWPDEHYIAYFQANTNTYTTPERLYVLCREAMSFPGVEAIAIATRPDCLPREIIDCLIKIAEEIPLFVELGLQTVFDETAVRIHRGYPFSVFLSGYEALKAAGIPVTVHLINGFPWESEEQMLDSAKTVAALLPFGVKLHMLHVMEQTPLAALYQKESFPLLSKEGYVSLVCRQIALFSPDTVIERITGDGDRNHLIAPRWTTDKRGVLAAIDNYFRDHDLFQGDHFSV